MPTIIALDISLSMQRLLPGRSEHTYHHLAVKGITQFLDYLSSQAKLEFVSLMTFHSVLELKVDFTRDYDQIRQAAKKVEPGDKIDLINMLMNVTNILNTTWGTQQYCQLVIFTDCGLGMGKTSLKNFMQNFLPKKNDAEFSWMETLRPVMLNFICMGVHSDYYYTCSTTLLQQFLDFTGLRGTLIMSKPPKDPSGDNNAEPVTTPTTTTSPATPHKSELGRSAMYDMIERLCDTSYKLYESTLKCGGYFRMECPIVIWPPPYQYSFDDKVYIIADRLEVCGFLSLADIGTPATLSRHLILPKVERERRRSVDKYGNTAKAGPAAYAASQNKIMLDVNNINYEFEKLEQDINDFFNRDADDSGDDADTNKTNNQPVSESQKESMCVLLHGALKLENMAALVILHENWFGLLYSYGDGKRKCNLMLNILLPGNHAIPWIGDLQLLATAEDLLPGESPTFAVKSEKRSSYSQNCVVWIRQASLQSDVQKVLRHAKKMPDKTQNFYKELNRIRREALSIGFIELLDALATLFEKESANLQLTGSNAECALQLQHAAAELRRPTNRDIKVSIIPLQKFSASGGSSGSSSIGGSEATNLK